MMKNRLTQLAAASLVALGATGVAQAGSMTQDEVQASDSWFKFYGSLRPTVDYATKNDGGSDVSSLTGGDNSSRYGFHAQSTVNGYTAGYKFEQRFRANTTGHGGQQRSSDNVRHNHVYLTLPIGMTVTLGQQDLAASDLTSYWTAWTGSGSSNGYYGAQVYGDRANGLKLSNSDFNEHVDVSLLLLYDNASDTSKTNNVLDGTDLAFAIKPISDLRINLNLQSLEAQSKSHNAKSSWLVGVGYDVKPIGVNFELAVNQLTIKKASDAAATAKDEKRDGLSFLAYGHGAFLNYFTLKSDAVGTEDVSEVIVGYGDALPVSGAQWTAEYHSVTNVGFAKVNSSALKLGLRYDFNVLIGSNGGTYVTQMQSN